MSWPRQSPIASRLSRKAHHPGPALRGRARYPQYELYELIARRLERRQPGDVPSKPKGVGGWEIIIVVSLLTLLGLGALRWLGTI